MRRSTKILEKEMEALVMISFSEYKGLSIKYKGSYFLLNTQYLILNTIFSIGGIYRSCKGEVAYWCLVKIIAKLLVRHYFCE